MQDLRRLLSSSKFVVIPYYISVYLVIAVFVFVKLSSFLTIDLPFPEVYTRQKGYASSGNNGEMLCSFGCPVGAANVHIPYMQSVSSPLDVLPHYRE
jgi:hypothetical protein